VKAPWPVTITQLDDGSLLVSVGCKTMSYWDHAAFHADLRDYFEAPEATIKGISKRYGWSEPGEQLSSVPDIPGGTYVDGGASAGGR
jgi:hypothetical protein